MPIVGAQNCTQSGSRLMRCRYETQSISMDLLPTYVPAKSELTITRSGTCSTQYPIQIKIKDSNQKINTYNALLPNIYLIPQQATSAMSVEIVAPYKNIAYFPSSCVIEATLTPNSVNISELTSILSTKKNEALDHIRILDDRILDKTTISTLMQITLSLEQLVRIAGSTSVDFYSLNEILAASCDPETSCSWTEQISLILDDPAIQLPFMQQFMLFQLGQQLDLILPADCADNNCIIELIDDELAGIIQGLRSNINTTTLEDAIKQLVTERFAIEDLIAEYQSVAETYSINWNQL
ncbi:MAG: hypothetical protein NVV73_07210 [Cellvibrionaceae bacterium]|nr:hypothetical protein [Cellvibrionaceae bacterium]